MGATGGVCDDARVGTATLALNTSPGASGMLSPTSQTSTTSTSSLPFAHINIKPQSRQKTLKLTPAASALNATLSTLQAYHATSPSLSPSNATFLVYGAMCAFF